MYFLISSSTGRYYRFQLNTSITIGRKETDILIENDKSISRLHATLPCSSNSSKGNSSSMDSMLEPLQIFIQDEKSKIGTLVNGKKLTPFEKVPLYHNFKIRLGSGDAIYKIQNINIVPYCAKELAPVEKSKVTKICKDLCIHVEKEFKDHCTHVVAKQIGNLTSNLVLMVLQGIQFVTLQWLEAIKKESPSDFTMPKEEDYLPLIKDKDVEISDFSANKMNSRKDLFSDFVFVFSNEEEEILKDISKIISMTGGECSSLEQHKKQNYNPDTKICAIQTNNSSIMVKEGFYVLNEKEIMLAIMKCSTDKIKPPRNSDNRALQKNKTSRTSSKQSKANETDDDATESEAAGEGYDSDRTESIIGDNDDYQKNDMPYVGTPELCPSKFPLEQFEEETSLSHTANVSGMLFPSAFEDILPDPSIPDAKLSNLPTLESSENMKPNSKFDSNTINSVVKSNSYPIVQTQSMHFDDFLNDLMGLSEKPPNNSITENPTSVSLHKSTSNTNKDFSVTSNTVKSIKDYADEKKADGAISRNDNKGIFDIPSTLNEHGNNKDSRSKEYQKSIQKSDENSFVTVPSKHTVSAHSFSTTNDNPASLMKVELASLIVKRKQTLSFNQRTSSSDSSLVNVKRFKKVQPVESSGVRIPIHHLVENKRKTGLYQPSIQESWLNY